MVTTEYETPLISSGLSRKNRFCCFFCRTQILQYKCTFNTLKSKNGSVTY